MVVPQLSCRKDSTLAFNLSKLSTKEKDLEEESCHRFPDQYRLVFSNYLKTELWYNHL